MIYIYGLLGMVLGALMVIKTEWLVATFGKSSWAEQHLGVNGGTRLLYKLIGLVIILIALLGMTGQLGSIVMGIIGPLFGIN